MIAPACDICDEWDTGAFVQFKVIAPKQIEHNKMLERNPDIEGHPYGERFFCPKHLEIARKYSHLPYYEEALPLIKQEIASSKNET